MATYFPSPDFLRQRTAENFSALYPQALGARMGEVNQYAHFLRGNQNPYVTQSFERLMNAAPIQTQQVGQTSLGGYLSGQALQAFNLSPLQQTLQSQALSGLNQGSGLSQEDQRAATQAASAAYAARGMAMGNPAAAAEILNRYNLGQQRLDQRQRFGLGVDQQLQTAQNAARSFALGVDQQEQQRQQFNSDLQLRGDHANQGFALNRASLSLQQDPARFALHGPTMVAPALGMSSEMANSAYNAAVAKDMAAYNAATAKDMNVYNTNFAKEMTLYNANIAREISERNNAAALQAARMQAKSTRTASNRATVGTGINTFGAVAGTIGIGLAAAL